MGVPVFRFENSRKHSTDEFAQTVLEWLAPARHPKLNRPYTELVYQPMLEVLPDLRANGFKTFIVSGGGIEFIRVFLRSEQRSIGSCTKGQ
jgi:phosphoserine phosphatase